MELIANTIQLVEEGANVSFTDEVVGGCNSILHRSGSGLATLRGITTQCRARFKVFFSGNIAIPTDGTVGAISFAIAINGEPVTSTSMIVTPTAVDAYFNVASAAFIDVPKGCCVTIAVTNTSDQAVNMQNANLIVERVA